MSKKKFIRNIIIFVALIFITFIVIFKKIDMALMVSSLKSINIFYLILGLFAMLCYFSCEAINIRHILNVLGSKVSFLNSLKYTFIGFFFSGITPAASGGQPMEIYYMKDDGIPINRSTIALLIQICSFQIVTITCGIIGAIVNYKILRGPFIIIFILGVTFNLMSLIVIVLSLFSKKIVNKIVGLFIKLLNFFKYKNINELKKKIDKSLEEYCKSSEFIKSHKIIIVRSILIVCIQAFLFYMIPFLVYKSFDLHSYNIFEIMSMQAMLFMSVSCLPLPGAVGVSEGVFLKIYSMVFGHSLLAGAMILNRLINFYFYIIIGLGVVIFNIIRKYVVTNQGENNDR